MGLNRLDFLSNAPKNFIFRNTSNKTNFGGVLFLLYIFIVVLIIIFYLCKFYTDEDYSVEYTYYHKILNAEEEEIMLNTTRYNPFFDFKFQFYFEKNDKKYSLPDDFVLINMTNDQKIPLNVTLKRKVTDIDIAVAMNKDYNKSVPRDIYVYLSYQGFVLDHQNITSPLYQSNLYSDRLKNDWLFVHDKPSGVYGFWNLVKYKADIGFLKLWNKLINKKDEESQKIIGLKYNSRENMLLEDVIEKKEMSLTINGTEYKVLGLLKYSIDYSHWEEYKRTKKSILDTISIICSLSLTIFNILSFFVNFYSQNFDNYKIIVKILGNSYNIKEKSKKLYENIDMNKNINKKDSLLGKNDEIYRISINDEDTDKLDEENNQENNDNHYNINEEKNKSRNLPKLTFFDYFFNYIY